jgi:hypothetical protein
VKQQLKRFPVVIQKKQYIKITRRRTKLMQPMQNGKNGFQNKPGRPFQVPYKILFRFGHHRQKKIVAQNYQRFKHHFQSKNDKIPKLISGLDGVYSLKRLSSA